MGFWVAQRYGWMGWGKYINLGFKGAGQREGLFIGRMSRVRSRVGIETRSKASTEASEQKQRLQKDNELVSLVSSKIFRLSQLLTSPSKLQQALMQQLWQQKIKSRLEHYPHIPGPKLFNKLSEECWNEVFSLTEQSSDPLNPLIFGESILLTEMAALTSQLAQLQQRSRTTYSI